MFRQEIKNCQIMTSLLTSDVKRPGSLADVVSVDSPNTNIGSSGSDVSS